MVVDAHAYLLPFPYVKVIRSTTLTLLLQDHGEALVVMGATA